MPLVYDFFKLHCICPGTYEYIGMKTIAGAEVSSFPVTVYNVNEEAIGTAADKAEYISLWNSSPANQTVGVLSGLVGPFSFTLKLNSGQVLPDWVIGEPGGIVDTNLLIDSNGDLIVDSNGDQILY